MFKHKDGTPIFEDPSYTDDESELKDDSGTYVSGDRLFISILMLFLMPVWAYIGWELSDHYNISVRLVCLFLGLFIGFIVIV